MLSGAFQRALQKLDLNQLRQALDHLGVVFVEAVLVLNAKKSGRCLQR